MAATPDTITQDGSSQALVVVVARDVSGRAVANLPIRFDVTKDGRIVDYGTLSAKTGLTSADGRAQVVYTAPAPLPNSPTPYTTPPTVNVCATPTGANYANEVARAVEIRLVPVGAVPPSDTLVASFAYSPTSPGVGVVVAFNASASKSLSGVASYAWDFGDGSTASGVVAQHTFSTAGTYAVRLTVTDTKGLTAWTTKDLTVAAPTASFTWSPASPVVVFPATEVIVTFDAGLSWVAPPATITSYSWTCAGTSFGATCSPSSATGASTHFHLTAGTYDVTLTVTDSNLVATLLTKSFTVTVR
jgi:PKD repeat protein